MAQVIAYDGCPVGDGASVSDLRDGYPRRNSEAAGISKVNDRQWIELRVFR